MSRTLNPQAPSPGEFGDQGDHLENPPTPHTPTPLDYVDPADNLPHGDLPEDPEPDPDPENPGDPDDLQEDADEPEIGRAFISTLQAIYSNLRNLKQGADPKQGVKVRDPDPFDGTDMRKLCD
jgi:hypothetical protein